VSELVKRRLSEIYSYITTVVIRSAILVLTQARFYCASIPKYYAVD